MDEVEKLKMQNHVGILQNEYHRMMQRADELERENGLLRSSAGVADCLSFTSRIMKSISELFNNKKYSDVQVRLKGRRLFGHKLVLGARYEAWGAEDLEEIDLEDLDLDVGEQTVRWLYTNKIQLRKDTRFILGVMSCAFRFDLKGLCASCEEALVGLVDISNCINFYVKAEEFEAEKLKHVCYDLISSHWEDFTESDFKDMTPRLLLDILKRKTGYPLHAAIRAKREDVVLLYLSETKNQWPQLVNSFDEELSSPLDLVLRSHQLDLATSLVDNYCANAGLVEPSSGASLLHLAVSRGDEQAAIFLLEHGADAAVSGPPPENATALHVTCGWRQDAGEREGMARVARLLLLRREVDPNAKDAAGETALHRAVRSGNATARQALLAVPQRVDLDLRNDRGECVLWLALVASSGPSGGEAESDRFVLPAELLSKGASPDAVDPVSGDSLVQRCAKTEGMLEAALFLAEHGADLNLCNFRGESALHTACRRDLPVLVRRLLELGADPNALTASLRPGHKREDSGISFGGCNGHVTSGNPFDEPDSAEISCEEPIRRSPLHLAVAAKNAKIAEIFLERQKELSSGKSGTPTDFQMRDAEDNTAFGLALWCELFDLARQMLEQGTNSVEERSEEGFSLLHQAIQRQHTQAAIFLMDNGANLHEECPKDRLTPLELAIEHDCPAIVEALCARGAEIDRFHPISGECPLWRALSRGRHVIAELLARARCDVDMWHWDGESEGTLLHKAMNLNEDAIVTFLVKHGCDVNAVRRPGPDGEGGEESRDGQSPLHMAAAWSRIAMVKAMLAREDVLVNKQDVEGNTPLHLALYNRDTELVKLFLDDQRTNVRLKNKRSSTPFHLAMGAGNEEAARIILRRDPSATEEVDKRGRNFLHIAIEKGDMKSFFFLLTIEANVNTRVCGDQQYTPLHLAVLCGNENILRSLLLKGARVNEEAIPKATALHLSASHNRAEMIGTLVEHRADVHARDDQGNNALHLSLRYGHLEAARELLKRGADAEAVNIRGRTPLHEMAVHSPERAVVCFEELHAQRPDLPLDTEEADGNSALLLAYLQGNKRLCVSLITAGASLGCRNRHGQTIFNFQHPSKELLPKLLNHLDKEPTWSDSEACLDCNTKFSLTTRKHHCRHCGRPLCYRCSSNVVPILKFNMNRPERVCQFCFDFLNCRF